MVTITFHIFRTVIELLVATVLLTYMVWKGIPILAHGDVIVCDVHGYYYECSGQPAEFYAYILYITCFITLLYILCNFYNLLWLSFPCFGKLSRVMSAYRSA